MSTDGEKSTFKVDIAFITLIKITLFTLALMTLARLVPLLMLCLTGVLLAVAAEPLLTALKRFMPRGWAVFLLMTLVTGALVGLLVFVSPPFFEQAGRILQKLPQAGSSLLAHIPNPKLRALFGKIPHLPTPDFTTWGPRLLAFGELAFGALTSLVLVLALMAYLLVDGRNSWRWLLAFFRPEVRRKLERTAEEVTPVISAYVVGQVITSVLCAIAVYIMLKSLSVPAALVLSVLAAFLDVLPIIGFIMTVIPACLFALTVSPQTSLIVLLLFGAYHAIENYVIVPMVYGHRLRVSGLVVLIAILAGVTLGGILGAILVLPVVASYPIIERIWLADYVGPRVIASHAQIERDEASSAKPSWWSRFKRSPAAPRVNL